MSYQSLADLARDPVFLDRIAACAATRGITQADKWATDNRWKIAATPGFDTAETLTDAMLLDAVQPMLG